MQEKDESSINGTNRPHASIESGKNQCRMSIYEITMRCVIKCAGSLTFTGSRTHKHIQFIRYIVQLLETFYDLHQNSLPILSIRSCVNEVTRKKARVDFILEKKRNARRLIMEIAEEKETNFRLAKILDFILI